MAALDYVERRACVRLGRLMPVQLAAGYYWFRLPTPDGWITAVGYAGAEGRVTFARPDLRPMHVDVLYAGHVLGPVAPPDGPP